MKLIGQSEILRYTKRYAETRKPLAKWTVEVENAKWASITDVRKTFANADGVVCNRGATITVFNIKGGNYRLLAIISYQLGLVTVKEILTHPEYSKNLWRMRY